MDNTYWHKQSDTPLFPELIWSRPENKMHAGKLAIIGGHAHAFACIAQSYQFAMKSGAGTIRVLLPDAIQAHFKGTTLEVLFSSSNPSGSFGRDSLADWLDVALWSDGVLIPGDLGRNSETNIVIEQFLQKYSGRVVLSRDAADDVLRLGESLAKRPQTTLVLTIAGLQRFFKETKQAYTITFDNPVQTIAERLHIFTTAYATDIVLYHQGILWVACGGQVSSSSLNLPDSWRAQTAATAAVWQIQNPSENFKALTTASIVFSDKH